VTPADERELLDNLEDYVPTYSWAKLLALGLADGPGLRMLAEVEQQATTRRRGVEQWH
jgi:hypothetical protein